MASKTKKTCEECKAELSNLGNLKFHVERKHPEKFDALFPKKVFQVVATCPECQKGFARKANLKLHIRNSHPGREDELFNDNITINSHKCTVCQHTDSKKSNLMQHFTQVHDIKMAIEQHTFCGRNEFLAWKQEVEKETKSSFVKAHGSGKGKFHTKTTYECHRSGQVRQRGTGKRHMKTQGSNKINGFCPAKMDVVVTEENYKVTFVATHVGHRQELGHLLLSDSERSVLAAKIASKIPFQSILDEIRDSLSNGELERLHLLKKKDLFNIEQCFSLNKSSVRHANDAISIESWVNEMTSCVLFYKPQDCFSEEHPNLKKDDFVLVIMTRGQKELLGSFGNDTICIDGTHGLNGYGFEMHTLLVLDDLREGFPVAFLISNRSDEEIIKIFFSCILDAMGEQLRPRIFMSDMAEVYYNAWLQVMFPSEKRLFCTWHVDRAWRNNLQKVATNEKKAAVYKMLRTLLQETDVNTFGQMIANFMMLCKNDPETVEFGNYFEKYYANRVQEWAYCYRMNCGVNTNMHLERMHCTIKYLYLNGKFVKRLDKAINAIMKFVRDKLFERVITIHKGKISTKLKDLRKRHKTSEELDINLIVQTETGWEIASASLKDIYVVQEIRKNCQCQLVCTECNACLHQYSCSCIDSSIKWNMCKHIHGVCRYKKANASKEVPGSQSTGRCLYLPFV